MLCKAVVSCVLLLLVATPLSAQDANSEQQIAEKFLQILLRRPRPGTALDRVYGYHVQAGSLDQFLVGLQKEANAGGDGTGQRFMLLGLLRSQRGNDAGAAESFAKAEGLLGDDAMASYYHGKSLLLIGKTDSAAKAFQRSIDRNPVRNEALPVFTELGRLYQRGQQSEKALAVWNRLESMYPGDSRVGEQIAQTLADEGQHEEALERFEKLAEDNKDSSDYKAVGYRIAAAELKRQLGQADQAVADLESILQRLRPASWLYTDVRRRIEAGFLRSGDYGALAEYYQAQVTKNPDDVPLRLRLGKTLAKSGRINDAQTALQETVKLAPDETDVRLALIDVLKTIGNAKEAAVHLEKLVEQDSGNPDFLVQLGYVRLDDTEMEITQRRQLAAKAWSRLAEARKEDAVVTAQVGDLMRRIDHHDDALSLYRRAIELAPDQPQYREYLGEYLHKLDRKEEALQAWREIAEGDRQNRDNLIRLGEVLNTFDHPQQALDAIGRAMELDPTFAHRLRYAELLSRAEKYDDSLSQLDAAAAVAETLEEREQLLRARIGVYGASGKLDQRIAAIRTMIEKEASPDHYRRLALMLDAASRTDQATAAIESAMKLEPENTDVLAIAGELYRKTSRYGDAIAIYRSLTKYDPRFLPNYLKRIASLQMRLGQVDQAMETAEELIAAQPGNPEPYRIYAQQCFQVGRDDQGIDKLRRALRAAPRDPDSRRALASALASRFRTDEAIELYWKLLNDDNDLGEQIGLVSTLSTLYDRRGDIDRLLSRLELRGRETSDMRSAVLLTAEAHRAIRDIGAARQTLEPLLVENPRDVELLEQMVKLSEAADDAEAAHQYQKRLVSLADTPENRTKLVMLMVDSGQINAAEAALQYMQVLDDPEMMIKMIDRAITRRENKAAIQLCNQALEKQTNLWEVRIRLAGLLLIEGEKDQAITETNKIDALDLPADTKPESETSLVKKRKTTTTTKRQQTLNPMQAMYSQMQSNRRFTQAQQAYQLASFFQVGRYAGQFSYGSRAQPKALNPKDFGEAKFLVTAIRLAAASKDGKLDEVADAMVDEEELKTTDDAEVAWNAFSVNALKSTFGTAQIQQPYQYQKTYSDSLWRLAKLDPSVRDILTFQLLSTRAQIRKMASGKFPRQPGATLPDPPEPLTDEQLEFVKQAYKTFGKGAGALQRSGHIARMLYDELVAIGREDEAKELRDGFVTADTPATIGQSLAFLAGAKQTEEVAKLLDSIGSQFSLWSENLTPTDRTGLVQGITAVLSLEEILNKPRLDAIDLLIAIQSLDTRAQRRSSRGNSQRTGMTHVSYQVKGQYQHKQIVIPLSSRLMSQSFASQIFTAMKAYEDSPWQDRLIQHLSSETTLFEDHPTKATNERRLREVLATFIAWWGGDKARAYDLITAASDRSPEETDLWIERARLAADLNRPKASLDALDAIHPTDLATLQTRELAAMNLASELGQIERSKTAARRLFGMRLDHNTEMALAQQLSQLGMPEMATAVLQRSRRRGGKSTQELLVLAKRFDSAGDKEAAAEVAFGALRKLQKGHNNQSYYRRQAVQILKSAGRLKKLLKQAEKRVASAPKSVRLKLELADLYTAAERKEDSDRMFEEITKLQPNDAGTLWRTGQQLYRAKKYGEAIDKYLAAIEREPSRLQQGYWELRNAATQGKQTDKVYRAMIKMDLKQIQPHVLSTMLTMRTRGRTKKPSEAAVEFVDHVLKNAPTQSFGQIILQLVSDKKLLKSEGVTDAIERVFADKQIFVPTSLFWRAASYSNNGLNGPLKPCLMAMEGNEEVTRRVRDLVTKHAEADEKNELSRLIILMIDSNELSIEQIESKVKPFLDNQESVIPYTVWWEFGQVVAEKSNGEKLVVSLLEHARDNVTNQRIQGYQYSVDAQLTNAYIEAGMSDKARVGLLRAYRETDNSRQNQHNPGYGDYQDLTSYLSIGKKLLSINDRLNTIRIYSDALATPERFEAAKKWGGRQEYRKKFESGLSKAMEQLSDSECMRFLTFDRNGEDENEVDASDDFKLIRLTASPRMDPNRSSIAALVIHRIRQSDNGEKKLLAVGKSVAEKLQESPNDLSLLALRVLIAVALDEDSAADVLKSIVEKLPTTDDNHEIKVNDSLLSLYSPALMAIDSKQPAVVAAAGKLAGRIAEIAERLENSTIAATLNTARIRAGSNGADPIAAYQQLLDVAAPKTTPPKVVSQSIAKKCLELAEFAADDGAWLVTVEALRRGFGGGPPLTTMAQTQGVRSAFSRSPRTAQLFNSSSTAGKPNDLTPLIHRMISLLERIPKSTSATEENSEVTTDHASLNVTNARFDALLDMVLPDARKTEVFPYCVNLLARSSAGDSYTPNTSSLIGMLARDAVQTDQVSKLRQRMQTRNTGETPSIDHQLISVYVAIAEHNEQQIESALSKLGSTVDVAFKMKVPSKSGTTTANPFSVPRKNSAQYLINTTLHAVFAAHDEFGVTPAIAQLESQVLKVASKSNELSAASATWAWIVTELAKYDQFTDEQIRRANDSFVDSIQTKFSRNGFRTQASRVTMIKPSLAIAAVQGARWEYAAKLYRGLATLSRFGNEPDSAFLTIAKCPKWAIEFTDLPAEQRYEFLSKLTFGKNFNRKVRTIHALANYAVPPESLAKVVPHLASIKRISLAHPELPIFSTAIGLAEAAAECGRTEELIGRLREHVDTPGGEVDAMIGLALLADGRLDLVGEMLVLVDKQLADSKPEKHTNDPLPSASMILIARSLSHEALREQALQAWKQLDSHASHRKLGITQPYIRRLTAMLDGTITPRNDVGSDLAHWVSVPMPPHYQPISESLNSRFTIENGTVRAIGSARNNALMLKYPLVGDYQFEFRSPVSVQNEPKLLFAGTSYDQIESNDTIRATSHVGRTSNDVKIGKPNKVRQNNIDVRRLEVDGEELRVKIAGRETVVDQRTENMPMPGIFFHGTGHTMFSDVKITGRPRIPRRVNLIDTQLRGWSSGLTPGILPDTELPNKNAKTLKRLKRYHSKRRNQLDSRYTWYVENQELRTDGARQANQSSRSENPGRMLHIQYMRPLLDGESISYEYFLDAGQLETYPTIGRIGILLRSEGVKLRWLPQATSLESYEMDPLNEVDPDEPSGDGIPQLKQNDWNRVTLTRNEDKVKVVVNNQEVCQFPVAEDQRFGLLAEKDREVRVKNATLTGPWPKGLPDDLMKTK